jgi:hypothetical protein
LIKRRSKEISKKKGNKMSSHLIKAGFLLSSLLLTTASALAQATGVGGDMWNGRMQQLNMFRPHANNCNAATDAFIQVQGASLGFCIEKVERVATTWEVARDTCLNTTELVGSATL